MFKKLLVLSALVSAGINAHAALHKGPNHEQKAPVLISATTNGSRTLVKGVLKSKQAAAYIIQFFSNPTNRNPITEGQNFLGQITLKKGEKCFSASLPCTNAGSFISATATRVEHHELTNTSMFSANVEVN